MIAAVWDSDHTAAIGCRVRLPSAAAWTESTFDTRYIGARGLVITR